MEEIYKTPDSELGENNISQLKPSRKLVDITFWLAHTGLILSIMLAPPAYSEEPIPRNSIYLMAIAVVSMLIYYFAIGSFAKKMGRSAIVWGLGSFLFSPLTVWLTYISSFIIKPKDK